jgi:hypothetical protein
MECGDLNGYVSKFKRLAHLVGYNRTPHLSSTDLGPS